MKKVIWKVSSKNIDMASFRYRCLMPLRWMSILDPQTKHIVVDNLDACTLNSLVQAVIFVKSFTNKDLRIAEKANQRKIPIYIDLCDNFFHRYHTGFFNNEKEKETLSEAYSVFRQISCYSKAIVTTGCELAEKIINEFPDLSEKITVLPDPIETQDDVIFFEYFKDNSKKFNNINPLLRRLLRAPIHLFNVDVYKLIYWKIRSLIVNRNKRKTKSKISLPIKGLDPISSIHDLEVIKSTPLKKILWFGNSGIPNLFGITDILLLKDVLLELSKNTPYILIVCSNNKILYDQYIAPITINSCYIPWSLKTNLELLKLTDVVIVPNPKNEFTVGKSANRTLLALSLKKPVIASYTPALDSLKDLVFFENWAENILKGLYTNHEFENKWNLIWPKIFNTYSSKTGAKEWLEVLNKNN